MRIVSWIFNFLLFLIALGFALSNTEAVDLRFLIGDLSWRAPLVIFLLVFFAAGVVIGLLAAVPAMFRQRREIARLNRELRHASAPQSRVEQIPPEATIGSGIGMGV